MSKCRGRTHRERKEIYVKNLEVERGQALELNYKIMREKEALQSEVARLRTILIQHGLNPDDGASSHLGGGSGGNGGSGGGGAPSSSGSASGSYAMDFARSQFSPSMSPQQFDTPSSQNQHGGGYNRAAASLDYESIGINFVLKYDFPQYSLHTSFMMQSTPQADPDGAPISFTQSPHTSDVLSNLFLTPATITAQTSLLQNQTPPLTTLSSPASNVPA
jgi:hypothetical protein